MSYIFTIEKEKLSSFEEAIGITTHIICSLHELPAVVKQMTALRPPMRKMVGACYIYGIMDGEATANLSVQGEYDDENQTVFFG